MYDRFSEGAGGILGDDMGLGKTVQVFLAHIFFQFVLCIVISDENNSL